MVANGHLASNDDAKYRKHLKQHHAVNMHTYICVLICLVTKYCTLSPCTVLLTVQNTLEEKNTLLGL